MKRILGLIAQLLSPCVLGEEIIPWTTDQIVNAIWVAEGGHLTKYPYGIKSIPVRDKTHARKICVTTVNHAMHDWMHIGRFRHTCFITYLSTRYCPPSVDPVGNRNWIKNVKYWLKKHH